jgi:4-diphosphocytidyl-2-C-methyl-D-erythritol kinase
LLQFIAMTSLAMLAPAKLNLGLEILRRRPDGFHDLNTVFAALTFGDTVTLRLRGDRRITCSVAGADLAADESNLAVRAGLGLRERTGVDAGLDIAIEKRIPMGAGLGGGSSDAAAVLMGAPRIWGVPVAMEMLEEAALELGSDVPFFLRGGVARAGSRGEELEVLDVALPWAVLLVNPGIHVATPKAFAAVGRTGEREASDIPATLGEPAAMRDRLVNDFEVAVFAMHPELGSIKQELYDAGAHFALMSGSGSTLYGLFATDAEAHAAAARFPHAWTAVTRFLTTPAPYLHP